MTSRRDGGNAVTRALRAIITRQEPDPDFDRAADEALRRTREQKERYDDLGKRLDVHERRR